jgi:hypothetical protein
MSQAKCFCHLVVLFAFACFIPGKCHGQDAFTGFPPYQTYQYGSFDTVNVQDLSFGFAVPIASIPGRGLSLGVALHYSSSIWRLVQVAPGVSSSGWGWAQVDGYNSPGWSLGQVLPAVHYTNAQHKCNGGQDTYQYLSNFRVSEPDGTTHSFTGKTVIVDSPGPPRPSCPKNTTGPVTWGGKTGGAFRCIWTGVLIPSVARLSFLHLEHDPTVPLALQTQFCRPEL